jgi:hypothetical protein
LGKNGAGDGHARPSVAEGFGQVWFPARLTG